MRIENKLLVKIITLSFMVMMAFVLLCSHSGQGHAQNGQGDLVPPMSQGSAENPRALQYSQKTNDINARAISVSRLKTPDYTIKLWGIETPEGISSIAALEGRISLDSKIGGFPIQCDFRQTAQGERVAQCVSYQDVDLGLAMIREGYAVADRSEVYNTVFEELYLQAEAQARAAGFGIWSTLHQEAKNTGVNGGSSPVLALLCFIAIMVSILCYIMKQGLQKISDLQSETVDIFRNEQRLKMKEKYVLASMLASEIESNTSKIEAYLMIYREMLVKMTDPQVTPKYMESGDIVQRQPALDRNIFDSNTDKLELLTPSLASKIIHFYARIKTKPDYATLEPDMPRMEAKSVIEQVIDNAEELRDKGQELVNMINSLRPQAKKRDDGDDVAAA